MGGNKYPLTKIHDTTYIYDGSWANMQYTTLQRKAASSCGHKQDIEQFMEINYAQIADI